MRKFFLYNLCQLIIFMWLLALNIKETLDVMLLRACFLLLVLFYLSISEKELKLSAHKPLQDFLPSVQARMLARIEGPVLFSLGLSGLSCKQGCFPTFSQVGTCMEQHLTTPAWPHLHLGKITCEMLWSLSPMMELLDVLTFLLWERHQPWIPGSVVEP